MKTIKLILMVFLIHSSILLSQTDSTFTIGNTKFGNLKIPGNWEFITKMEDSGQFYYKNQEGIIIAISQNPQRAYSFYQKSLSNIENIILFFKWDSEYYKTQNYETIKLKENVDSEYIIWKYNDKKMDNIFLFGINKKNFLNLLIYTDLWNEERKISFLENLYHLNKNTE